jgi:hypothetical protein
VSGDYIYLGVVQWVRELDGVPGGSGLCGLLLGDCLGAVIVLLDGDNGEGTGEDRWVRVREAVLMLV